MTATSFPTSDANTRKLWSDRLIYDTISDQAFVGNMIGAGILIKEDKLDNEAGDQITYSFLNRISKKGFVGMASATGNEQNLTYTTDLVIINQLRQAVQIPNKGTIDQQRVPFALNEDTYTVLRNWLIERMTLSAIYNLTGYAPTTITWDGETYTGDQRLELWGMNTPRTPTRVLLGNGLATELLVNGDTTATAKLTMIDSMTAAAAKVRPYIKPLTDDEGGVKFRWYVHIDTFYQLVQDTSAPLQFRDILLAQITAGENKNVMIGMSFVYNQVEVIATDKMPFGQNSTAALANCRRGLFCGKEAGGIAFGQGYSGLAGKTAGMKFTQDMVDIEQYIRIAVVAVWGLQRTQFNGQDHGSIVTTTYTA